MRILVDADACPVKEIIEEVSSQFGLELIFVVNPHHCIDSRQGKVIQVDGDSQAVDLALVNMAKRGDIVVTQDYGLASMLMAKRSTIIHPNGWEYKPEQIDSLLMQRHLNAKARRAGLRTTNPKRRASDDNQRFRRNLIKLIESTALEGI